jgi:hypothetical protein
MYRHQSVLAAVRLFAAKTIHRHQTAFSGGARAPAGDRRMNLQSEEEFLKSSRE